MNEVRNIPNMDIPVISDDIKFWMVRTKEGFFFDEFIREEFIAIGWNAVTKEDVQESLSGEWENILKEKVRKIYGGQAPGASVSKCARFCNQLNKDDIAMIVGERQVAFAKIGEYYEANREKLTPQFEIQVHKDIETAVYNRDHFSCPYVKRRRIEVLRILERNSAMNPYLVNVMAVNRHSLSDLSEFSEIILSSCYDAFLYKGKLTLTFRVRQRDNISAVDLSEFILCAAKIISKDAPSMVTVKTALHSPGDILLQIGDFIKENGINLFVCYLIVFGGRIKDCEFPSILGVIMDIINRDYNRKKQEIELKRMEAETALIEEEVLEKRLDNLEKQRRLEISTIEMNAEALARSAERLQVEPDSATILHIETIMRRDQE